MLDGHAVAAKRLCDDPEDDTLSINILTSADHFETSLRQAGIAKRSAHVLMLCHNLLY